MICVNLKGEEMNLQLKRFRSLKGYSQDEMAQKLGIKKSRYGTWERGERMMSLEQAYNVTEILGCTLDELVGRDHSRGFADPGQAALNACYENMNDDGKGTLVSVARSLERDTANRIEKDGEELSEYQAKLGA